MERFEDSLGIGLNNNNSLAAVHLPAVPLMGECGFSLVRWHCPWPRA